VALTSGIAATHREANPQTSYDLLLEEAWRINKAITETQQKIDDIHDAVPSLRKSLIENCLNDTEMEFYRRICGLEEQLIAYQHKMQDDLKPQFEEIIRSALREDFPLNRNRPKEIEVGLVVTVESMVGSESKPSKSMVFKSGTRTGRKKPGPIGPRPAVSQRRAVIKELRSKRITGLDACKQLNSRKIPLPTKRKAEIYNNDWVMWFHNDPDGFHRLFSADLKRL
jgi:hypothetical protein